MSGHNALMARKSQQKDPGSEDKPPRDRHKPRRMVGLREVLAVRLEVLAQREATDITELTNRAVKELLERADLWPHPPTDK